MADWTSQKNTSGKTQTMQISIDGRSIGPNEPPYVVAEISANHKGQLPVAKRLIDEAKKAGANAVKLQTFTPDTITLNSQREDFRIRGGLWDGRSLYELYEEAHMPWDWHKPLFEYARTSGITIFSSPFDNTAVDLLEDLNAPAYKIASFEAIDLPLIRYVGSTGKPMIISTGMANTEEIEEAIEAALGSGCSELAILHCVSGYPAPAADYQLRTIPSLIARFGLVTGLSDHTLDNATAVASVALGASIVEKHFTLDRKGGSPDDSFSLEPAEMFKLCRDCYTAWLALGPGTDVNYELSSSEKGNIKFRRSLYFTRDLKEGDVIGLNDVRSVRPGFGLPPKYIDQILGKTLKRDVEAATPVLPLDLDI
jgi:pseudaminic acid synthase